MPFDFGKLNDAVTETFGDDVTCRPSGRASFSIPFAIFDDDHETVMFEDGVAVSSRVPALFVKRTDLPAGFRFNDGDRFEIAHEGRREVFELVDDKPDSAGGTVVILRRLRGRSGL